MTGPLPILIVFAAVVWSRLKLRSGRQWRRAGLEAVVLMGAGTILGSELLGLLHRLRPAWVGFGWVLAGVAGAFYLWRELRAPQPTRDRVIRRWRAFSFSHLLTYWHPLELATLGLVIGATGLIAWLSPPTNFDSMTYQLPRVMHWFQQATLEHYPTSNFRQLAYGPGGSYWQVQLWSLFDGDRAANLPQWAALVGCALALPLWLQHFFDRRAIALAVLTALTLPMALLQASSTQTDLQVGCWLLIATTLLSVRDRRDLSTAGLAGLAIGLAVVTKPNTVIWVAPLAVIAFWQLARAHGVGGAVRVALVWVTLSLLVCLPHFTRNWRWFGQPLGHTHGTIVESVSPALAVANTARWLMLNVPSMNAWLGLARTLEMAGIDPNHPAITFEDSKFSPPSRYVVYRLLLPDEDFAGYTVTLLLVGLFGLAAKFRSGLIPGPAPSSARAERFAPWLVALAVMFGLNCTLLKWQFWGNRLLLPWALLAFPVLVIQSGIWRRQLLRRLLGCLLLLQAVFVLCFSLNRPLIPLPPAWHYTGAVPLFSASRTERFLAGYNAEAAQTGEKLVDMVRDHHWRRVGLAVDENYPEYALWRALHGAGFDQVELHHINVRPPPGYRGPVWSPAVDGYISLVVPRKAAGDKTRPSAKE